MRACFTGTTVLPLVSGIACFAFVCIQFWVLKSRRPMKAIDMDTKREDRISQLPDDDSDIETEDRISQLPDDVITLIISRLYTRDVVRTSVLSRRWRHVYTFITEVRFHCSLMPGTHEGGNLRQSQMKFMQGVDDFLRRHCGSKLKSSKFTCCFAGCYLDIFRKLMKYVARLGVEQLIIDICYLSHLPFKNPCVFSSDFLPEASPMNRLPNQNVLKVLEFDQVSFTSEELKCILSNCSSLQSLKLISCFLPSKLRIHGPDLQLKSLAMHDCDVREIDLSAVNLISFEIHHLVVLKLSFSDVPLLQNLSIDFNESEVITLLREVSENLPNLECMFFKTYATCFGILSIRDNLIETIEKRQKGAMELEDVHLTANSLHRMLLASSEQTIGEKIPENTCDKKMLEILMTRYEKEVMHPIWGLVRRELLHAFLIQVQKIQLDVKQLLLELRQILRDNKLNIAILTALPGISLSGILAKLLYFKKVSWLTEGEENYCYWRLGEL